MYSVYTCKRCDEEHGNGCLPPRLRGHCVAWIVSKIVVFFILAADMPQMERIQTPVIATRVADHVILVYLADEKLKYNSMGANNAA